jgi:hypothetical protein
MTLHHQLSVFARCTISGVIRGAPAAGCSPTAHERAGANLELHIARGCGRHLVARREGSIDLRRRPVLRTRAPVRDLPVREDVPP